MAPQENHKQNKKSKKRQYESDEEHAESSLKKHKKDISLIEDSDEDQEVHDLEDAGNGVVLPAIKMIAMCEQFRQFLASNKKINLNAKHLKGQALEFVKSQDIEDASNVTSSLLHYLRISLKISSISLDTALRAMTDFLGRGETVLSFPDFPEKPPTLMMYYGKKHKMPFGIGTLKNISVTMNADSNGKAECEEEIAEITKTYLTNLRAFETRHLAEQDLTPQQVQHLRNMILRLQKRVEPRPPAEPKTPSSSKKSLAKSNKKKTPFELFVLANKEKYTEYDEEKRLRKLQKKFDKLDDDTRNMFVSMSINM